MNGIETLLRPRSVAIVGASAQVDKIGGRPLHYLQRHGYAGKVYPVSPRGGELQGLPAYTHVEELPEAPDCVILSVPAPAALDQLQASARAGAKSAILFSSGFAELGPEGRRTQEALARAASDSGLRLLGPNSIGCANFGCGAVLTFASIYQDYAPEDGPVAVVSQSGAVGAAAYALLREADVGVRYVCTTGNQADVDVADFAAAVVADPAVRVLLLYLEEVRHPAKLESALALAAQRGVQVLVLAAGASPSGVRMAEFHTGSAGMRDAALPMFEAPARRRVRSVMELAAGAVDLLLPPPGGGWERGAHGRTLQTTEDRRPRESGNPRIVVVSNSGASCVMAADACDAAQVPLAVLSAPAVATLDALLPPFSRSRNPVDLTAMLLADASLLGRCVAAVLDDPGCDALALSLLAVAGRGYDVARFARETADAARSAGKPAVFSSPDARVRQAFAAQGLSVFASEPEAVAALAMTREISHA